MSAKNLKTRAGAAGSRRKLNLGVSVPALSGSFHTMLDSCAGEVRDQGTQIESLSSLSGLQGIAWRDFCSKMLRRAWSFLHARYKISTTKRLRVSETISLGEKRFVAIVAVEGREFLIGGGVSGVSLLAQLGSATGAASDCGEKIGDSLGAL
jgi:hypothetical protein